MKWNTKRKNLLTAQETSSTSLGYLSFFAPATPPSACGYSVASSSCSCHRRCWFCFGRVPFPVVVTVSSQYLKILLVKKGMRWKKKIFMAQETSSTSLGLLFCVPGGLMTIVARHLEPKIVEIVCKGKHIFHFWHFPKVTLPTNFRVNASVTLVWPTLSCDFHLEIFLYVEAGVGHC